MAVTPYALSVHHFISSVGADAGFAAIIGLAVLVLVFFIHARETANLRARATEAEDALHRLEAYVDQIARAGGAPGQAGASQATPAPAPRVAAPTVAAPAVAAGQSGVAGRTIAPAPAPVGMMTAFPGAPAGVGAPALSAATRLIPAADDGAISIRSNRSAGVVERVRAATALADPPGPGPSTPAGGANGSTIPPVAPPPSAGQTGAGQTSAGQGGAGQTSSGRERLPLRPTGRPAAGASATRRRGGGQRSGGRVGRAGVIIAGALLIVVAVGAVLVLTNSSSSSNASSTPAGHAARTTSASSTHASKAKTSAVVSPASVTVAVLNGTSTTNLAHDISSRLTAAGYKQGAIATATDQTQSSTIVGYLPNEKRDALAVAKSLKLAPSSVQAVDPNNRTVACNGSTTSCPAQVVVTVGSNLSSNP
jgi:LytR cell envelope-related transcriptional attenuator